MLLDPTRPLGWLVPGARSRLALAATQSDLDATHAALQEARTMLAQARRQREESQESLRGERKKVAELRKSLRKQQGQIDRLTTRVEGRSDLGYLFIVTYGRSGSTLLQGILNDIPGYLIRGENRQLLTHLFEFHRTGGRERASQRRQQRKLGLPEGKTAPVDPFYGMDNFPPAKSLTGIRRLATETILRPGKQTRVVGFKEIRWDAEDVAAYVDWLRKVFPGARFVVNTRALDAVVESKWWAEVPDARERLTAVESRLTGLVDSLGEAAYHLRYDDYIADIEALVPFFEWLGEEYDVDRLRALLDVPHSY